MQWSKQTAFKGWPYDCFIFHAPLFVKSTEPTNIFKLGVKETGQSASTIYIYLKYVVVVLLFYVHDKHLRSCRDNQLT